MEAVSSTCLVRTRRPDGGLPSDLGACTHAWPPVSCSACLTQPSPLLLEVRVHQSAPACLLARKTRLLEVYCHAFWKTGVCPSQGEVLGRSRWPGSNRVPPCSPSAWAGENVEAAASSPCQSLGPPGLATAAVFLIWLLRGYCSCFKCHRTVHSIQFIARPAFVLKGLLLWLVDLTNTI